MPGGSKQHHADAALSALLTAANIQDAAAEVGISERTLRRWLADPVFKRQYVAAKRELLFLAITRAQWEMLGAVTMHVDILHAQDAPAMARLRAADALIALAFKGLESEDIDARLTALEQHQEPP